LIDRPQDAGADRLVGVIAGHSKYGGALLTGGFGSAPPLAFADKDGHFIRGVLAGPGRLTAPSCFLLCGRPPRPPGGAAAKVIGTGTVTAMQSGIFWGYVGLVDSLLARIKAEYGQPMKVIATGGLAGVFQEETGLFDAIEPDLMSLGLLEVWRRNRK